MSALRQICGSLMQKAAHQKTYDWTVYQNDLRCYNAAASRYREIGARLNVLLNS